MTDCQIWPRSCTRNGYGQVFRDGTMRSAHRVAYEDRHGPIPKGWDLHHTCGTRACVNVEHMEAVRHDEHAGRLGHGKLVRSDARMIRFLLAAGWTQRELATAFGVCRPQVSMIQTGKRWATA